MNTKNNQRFQQTGYFIEQTFIDLLKNKEIDKITVSEICKLANINRTTFYLHYLDIYDLLQKTETKMSEQMLAIFTSNHGKGIGDSFIKLFYFIREHHDFYQAYFRNNNQANIISALLPGSMENSAKHLAFKMGFKNLKEFHYHQEFFKAGIIALVKLWLNTGCEETPEELAEIIGREYSPQRDLFLYGDNSD